MTTPWQAHTVVVTRGVPGPAGRDGESQNFTRHTPAPLSALVVVWEDPTGAVHPLDYRDDAHIDLLAGLTVTSGGAGAVVTIQRSAVLDAHGLGLAPGRVWLGVDGRLTQTPPQDGCDILVGYATADERIYIDFSEAIFL